MTFTRRRVSPKVRSMKLECRLQTEDRGLAQDRELATDGGVNGPGDAVLVLPDTGEYAAAVWRRLEPGETFEYERVWRAGLTAGTSSELDGDVGVASVRRPERSVLLGLAGDLGDLRFPCSGAVFLRAWWSSSVVLGHC
ncbi:hypothetical protein ABZX69_27020 [Streptomyces sp. NPDC004074]|uniref:hypothetical protein n=1 Tax=unclassified Streptomyces TaxID=2593676 RepID=UPI0033A2D4AD